MKRSKKRDPYEAIRTDAIIAGSADVVLVRAPISTSQSTVISPKLAQHVGGDGNGPVRCTVSAIGRFCGPTQPVTVALDECVSVKVNAIVSPIRDPDLGPAIVGSNVLRRARPLLSFAPGRSVQVLCRRGFRP